MAEYIEDQMERLRRDNLTLIQSALRVTEINERLGAIIKEAVEHPLALDAVRFLAEIKELDPPNFVQMISMILVIRDSQDIEAVRLAAKGMLRNLERLEEKLDEARGELAASITSEREQ
jgi:hypothetical protein